LTAGTPETELLRRVAHVYPEDELRARLRAGRHLRVKLGVDPTAADIHLGHTVVLTKLRQFQDLGHQAVLIVGDFTAMVGDPSGRSATRPPLSRAEVAAHARTYEDQVFRVLDPRRAEVRRNSEWLGHMSLEDAHHKISALPAWIAGFRDRGTVTFEDGRCTGALPGKLLRSGA